MKSKLFLFALLFGLAACTESIPDVSGIYRDNGEYLVTDYQLSRFDSDPKKFKMLRVKKLKTSNVQKEFIYVYTSQNKFCEETQFPNCFTFDPKQGIRFDGSSEFYLKVN